MTNNSEESTQEFLERLEANPVRVAARAEFERAAQTRVAAERAASSSILKDLADVGLHLSSIWELVNTSEPYPEALPILMAHLEQGGYPSRVMEGIGRALAVKPAVKYWDRLVASYRNATDEGAREGAAVALAACVTKQHIGDLIALTRERGEFDEDPIYFLKRIMRLGGDEGRDFVASLVDDRRLGKEATALTKRAREGGEEPPRT